MTVKQLIKKYHLKYFSGSLYGDGTTASGRIYAIPTPTIMGLGSNTIDVYFCSNDEGARGCNHASIRHLMQEATGVDYQYNFYMHIDGETVLNDIEISDEPINSTAIRDRYHLKFAILRMANDEVYSGKIYYVNDSIIYFCSNDLEGMNHEVAQEVTGYRHSYKIRLNRTGEPIGVNLTLAIDIIPPLPASSSITEDDDIINYIHNYSCVTNVPKKPIKKIDNKIKVTIEDIADCFDCSVEEIEIEGFVKS